MKNLNMILAAAQDNAIGRKGGIPWHISEDFKFFKATTMGHTVIMGWMTWVSLGSKPLPGRQNFVISLEPLPEPQFDNVRFFSSLEDALEAAGEDAFIMGGGYTYRQALPFATKIYLTRIHTTIPDADTFFPALPEDEWKITASSGLRTDPVSGLEFEFLTYERN